MGCMLRSPAVSCRDTLTAGVCGRHAQYDGPDIPTPELLDWILQLKAKLCMSFFKTQDIFSAILMRSAAHKQRSSTYPPAHDVEMTSNWCRCAVWAASPLAWILIANMTCIGDPNHFKHFGITSCNRYNYIWCLILDLLDLHYRFYFQTSMEAVFGTLN